jgi:hypothetical protein
MPFPSAAIRRPSLPLRALVWVGVPMLLGVGVVSSSFAQSAPGGYGPGPGMERMRGGGRMGPPGGGHRGDLIEAMEGPLAPAVMQDSVGIGGKVLEDYAQRYSTLMAATRPSRDSLRVTMQTIRTAFDRGDRAAARDQRQDVERQSKLLIDRDKEFEKGLKNLLSTAEQKRYQKLKQDRKQQSRERWQRNRAATGSQDGWTYRANGR